MQSGFSPDAFWEQTPLHFQLALQGYGKRLESDALARSGLAYESGAFAGLAYHGKLKPFRHYMKQPSRKMTAKEMLANMRLLAQRANRAFDAPKKPKKQK